MNKEEYQFYKSRGICTHCRHEKAEHGKTLCLHCKMQNREYNKKYDTEKLREATSTTGNTEKQMDYALTAEQDHSHTDLYALTVTARYQGVEQAIQPFYEASVYLMACAIYVARMSL